MEGNLTIVNETRRKPPALPFLAIKRKILGERCGLSIIFIGNSKSKKLNNTYRGKNSPTNVLSFQIEKHYGELFLNLAYIEKETSLYKKNLKQLVLFMLIHGMLHLKGHAHGSTMEKREKAECVYFSVKR